MESSEIIGNKIKFEKAELINAFSSTSHTYKVRINGKSYFMKQLLPEFAKEERYKQMFIKEFEAGKSIDNPYVVKYHSMVHDENGQYLLMDFVNGCNLKEKLECEPAFFKKSANLSKLVLQILEALNALHRSNIIYLDLTPRNIMLTKANNDVKIIDLGYCINDTNDYTAGSTECFRAPECVASNVSNIDARADIYSVGCLLRYIEENGIKLPYYLRKIQKRCMEPEKEKRYQYIDEIIAEIKTRKQKRVVAMIAVATIALFLLAPFTLQTFNAYRDYLAWESGEIPDKFEEGGIFYRVTNHDARTVEVTYKGDHPDEYTYEYKGGSVDIPATVTHIGRTFQVKSIASYFCKNEYVSRMSIAEGVDTIHKNAFTRCILSDTVHIPASVRYIGQEAFTPHAYIKGFVVDEGNSVYDSRGGCNAIIETATNTLLSGCNNTIIPHDIVRIERCAFEYILLSEEIVLPPSIKSIGEYAFYCANIERMIIPEGVTNIEQYTFQWCEKLQHVQLPKTLKEIGHAAFSHCSFNDFVIPDSVHTIQDYAFDCNNNLQTITIGSGVRSIGYAAFENCNNLKKVFSHIPADKVPEIDCGTFNGINSDCVLYVPRNAKSRYEKTKGWDVFKKIETFE
ncbi:MAG: leucine-rich repeat protein [Bacteroidaceae bacterium]|nr:leucine-rich repeat protein [Bacteroidaceae bacterium]